MLRVVWAMSGWMVAVGLFGVVAALRPATAAAAEPERPYLAVIETTGGAFEADVLRRAVAQALDHPVISLLERPDQGVRGVLSVAIREVPCSVRVRYRATRGPGAEGQLEGCRRLRPSRAVRVIVDVVREAEERSRTVACTEVIDPWRAAPRAEGARAQGYPPLIELLDPFASAAPPSADAGPDYRLRTEVIDPWASSARGEGGRALSPPRPKR